MRNPNGCRLVLLIAPALFFLLPLACLIVILERVSRSMFNNELNRSFPDFELTLYAPNGTSPDAETVSTEIRVLQNVAPPLALLGISVVSGLVAILAGCGVWELRRTEGSQAAQRTWCWVVAVSGAVVVGLSVGVLAWASAVQDSEGWSSANDADKTGQRYTRETWACQIDAYYPQQDWAGTVCGVTKATRFMLIPMALAAALIIFTAYILARDRGGLKWLFGGNGRYAAFESAYEMNPSTPAPGFQPAPPVYPMPQQDPAQPYPAQPYPAQPYPGPQFYQMPQQYPAQPYPPQQVHVALQTSKEGAEDRSVFR